MKSVGPLKALIGTAVVTLAAALGGNAHAASMENRVLTSPITGKQFRAAVISARSGSQIYRGVSDADMGTDSDGCRHTAGLSEYDLYVVTDPWSYFSALSVEWDAKGRFNGYMPPGFEEWVQSKDGFNSEFVTDRLNRWKKWQQIMQRQGQAIPPLKDWEMPQDEIAIDKKFRLALASYSQRRYPASFIGKVALTGVWAVRVRMNRPIAHTRLAGGIEEVNDKLLRHISEGETFDLDKWTSVYQEIFEGGGLTDEGYFTAGSIYLGFLMRQGEPEAMKAVLEKLTERFKDTDDGEILRVLVREKRRMLRQSYWPFLDQTVGQFRLGLAAEEFPRPQIPETVLAIAESLRRRGDLESAMDWYTCLARLPETQPRTRAEIRTAGGVPSGDAPYLVQLGWRADGWIKKLQSRGITYEEIPAGPDGALIKAIVEDGLGTADYRNPAWKPVRGGGQRDIEALLDRSGKAVLDYHFRMKIWPDTLDDMWIDGFVRDRNVLNRFHCPVTGERLMYLRPQDPTPRRTVLVATKKPIETLDGLRYGIYLANDTVQWVEQPMLPGEAYTGPLTAQ
jgi:hypothetical protein